MLRLLRKDHAGALEQFSSQLARSSGLSSEQVCTLLCNKARCELELEMMRKCVKTTAEALVLDPHWLRAIIIQSQALRKLGKTDEALELLRRGLEFANQEEDTSSTFDYALAEEIQSLVQQAEAEAEAPHAPQSVDAQPLVVGKTASPSSTSSSSPPPPPPPSPPPPVAAAAATTTSPSSSPSIAKSKPSSPDKKAKAPVAATSTKAAPTAKTTTAAAAAAAAAAASATQGGGGGGGAITKDMLTLIYKRLMDNCGNPISPSVLLTVRENLSHASGESLVDDLIALGYLQVNTNNLEVAAEIFSLLLRYRADLPACYLGLGSVFAMYRRFDEAIACFTKALQIDMTIADAWKRRGQTRAAKGLISDALFDLNKALELAPGDVDIFMQKGLVYHQVKNYKRALIEFRLAQAGGITTSASLFNYIGMCEAQLGNVRESMSAHEEAMALDASFKEAALNHAQILKEAGRWVEAERGFARAIAIDHPKPYLQGYSHRSFLYYGLGKPKEALADMKKAIAAQCSIEAAEASSTGGESGANGGGGSGLDAHAQMLVQAAMCYSSLGKFADASSYFDQALAKDPNNSCWFQKQVMLRIWALLDADVASYNLDSDIHPCIKDGWCKRTGWREHLVEAGCSSSYKPLSVPSSVPVVGSTSCWTRCEGMKEAADKLLERSSVFTKWIQLDTQGFLPNQRQHAMFGLAVLQMAKTLTEHVDAICATGAGLQVPNASSSSSSLSSSSSSSSSSSLEDTHAFNWRDLLDIAVKWRQVSEPNDPVWWIDRMPSRAFEEGFGLQTPLVTGQLKTLRYYSYFPQAFALLKELMAQGYFNASSKAEKLSEGKSKRLAAATSLEEVHALAGKDFYVIVPCLSPVSSSGSSSSGSGGSAKLLEGTRLTLVEQAPEGFEFTIRTPGTPVRWRDFDIVLENKFRLVVDAVAALRQQQHQQQQQPESASKNDEEDAALLLLARFDEAVLDLALSFFYYWVIFAPLSRGTAACGYAWIVSIAHACGVAFCAGLPSNKQLDWEAIFAHGEAAFIAKVRPWFGQMKKIDACQVMAGEEQETRLLSTTRGRLALLTFACSSS